MERSARLSERKRLLNDEGEPFRLMAFCDGVFAIAITLLVLNLHVPDRAAQKDMVEQLLDQWPTYISYIASFLLIGIFWINHHRVCRHIKRTDRLLLTVNLLFLMFIAVLPFPTAILGEYVLQPERHAAALIYGGCVFLTMVLFDIIWISADRHDLIDKDLHRQLRIGMQRSYLLGTGIYFFAVLLSLVSVEASLFLYILIPSLYITVPPFEHLLLSREHSKEKIGVDEAPQVRT
jgi:uncharacterized membrane protein